MVDGYALLRRVKERVATSGEKQRQAPIISKLGLYRDAGPITRPLDAFRTTVFLPKSMSIAGECQFVASH